MRIKKAKTNCNLEKPSGRVKFGTSGIRTNAEDMNNIICRASIIAYVRSATYAGKYVGIMITGSHSSAEYNGIKFSDYDGIPFKNSWEKYSEELINTEDNDLSATIDKIFRNNNVLAKKSDRIRGNILIGYDNRKSSVGIHENIASVLGQFNCNVHTYGECTYPELLYLTKESNRLNSVAPRESYIETRIKYYEELCSLTNSKLPISIDTSNGSTAQHVIYLKEKGVVLEVLNRSGGQINTKCGSDFVYRERKMPLLSRSNYGLTACFDGDGDSLIFYTNSRMCYSGDHQAVFLSQFIKKLLDDVNIKCNLGVLVNCYSNGKAIEKIESIYPVEIFQVGYKNAIDKFSNYDVAIAFEPVGHGGIYFSENFVNILFDETREQTISLKILQTLVRMYDGVKSDAITNLLVFICILHTPSDFNIYKENYFRYLAVEIPPTADPDFDEDNRAKDNKIQNEIDTLEGIYSGRTFARPSGNEKKIRVFAECGISQAHADILCCKVAQLIYNHYGGLGFHPEIDYSE